MTSERGGRIVEQPWFGYRDFPLHHGDWPPSYPLVTTSDSGLVFELDRDHNGERCGHWDLPRDVFCIMPKGHDTPHMPMSRELAARIGPLIVRSVSRYLQNETGDAL